MVLGFSRKLFTHLMICTWCSSRQTTRCPSVLTFSREQPAPGFHHWRAAVSAEWNWRFCHQQKNKSNDLKRSYIMHPTVWIEVSQISLTSIESVIFVYVLHHEHVHQLKIALWPRSTHIHFNKLVFWDVWFFLILWSNLGYPQGVRPRAAPS